MADPARPTGPAILPWPPFGNATYWEFELLNYRIEHGDSWTEVTDANGARQKLLNRIDFEVGGRDWVLLDNLCGDTIHQNGPDHGGSMVCGTLATPRAKEEPIESVIGPATDICRLLSLAQSNVVWWVEHRAMEDNHKTSNWLRCGAPPAPYKAHGEIIKQWSNDGTLKRYIEECYPKLAQRSEILGNAIDVYVEASTSYWIRTQLALLCILIDALDDLVVPNTPQIGPTIDSVIAQPDFKDEVHQVLRKLGDAWTTDRTNAFLGEIKRYNARPSFPESVKAAIKAIGIDRLDDFKIRMRNKLIHSASIDINADEMAPQLARFDFVALAMLLYLLGYTGQFYHWLRLGAPQFIRGMPDSIRSTM